MSLRASAAHVIAALSAMLVCIGDGYAQSTDYVVNTTADEVDNLPGDTQCLTKSGRCSLRAAVQELNVKSAGRIFLDKEVYRLTIPGANEDQGATGDLDIRAAIEIIAAGQDQGSTVIDATKLGDRVLDVHGLPGVPGVESLTLQGVTVSGGSVQNAPGGGIRATANVTLTQSYIIDNAAKFGGGIAMRQGSNEEGPRLTLTGSEVSRNRGNSLGGGIDASGVSRLRIQLSTISRNRTGGAGGGIFVPGLAADAVIEAATIANNRAGNGGGLSGTAIVVRTTFSNNVADDYGGAIADAGGTILNSTFSANYAPRGGAISGGGNSLSVRYSTFALNGLPGGKRRPVGAHVSWREDGDGGVTFNDTLLAFGTANSHDRICDVPERRMSSLGHNIAVDHSCRLAGRNDRNGTSISGFEYDLADNGGPTRTHALRANSNAINYGDERQGPLTDQRGRARPEARFALPDIGAFEFHPRKGS